MHLGKFNVAGGQMEAQAVVLQFGGGGSTTLTLLLALALPLALELALVSTMEVATNATNNANSGARHIWLF